MCSGCKLLGGSIYCFRDKAADGGSECGECETTCPRKIEIRRQLAEAHSLLSAGK